MDIIRKKLSLASENQLDRFSINSIEPFDLIFTPTYLKLELNQRFVAIKMPIDFFSTDELKRILKFKEIYCCRLSSTQKNAAKIGLEIKRILQEQLESDRLPPYQLSKNVLEKLRLLWLDRNEVQAIDANILINALCEKIDPKLLSQAREKSLVKFELAVRQSSWCVLLALHLGYLNYNFINQLRLQAFKWVIDSSSIEEICSERKIEIFELFEFVEAKLTQTNVLSLSIVEGAIRIESKLRRKIELLREDLEVRVA